MLFCHMLTSKMCLDFNQQQPDFFDGRGPLLQQHGNQLCYTVSVPSMQKQNKSWISALVSWRLISTNLFIFEHSSSTVYVDCMEIA
jgi:hypothetical protein